MRDLQSDIARGHRAAAELSETQAAFDAVRGAILKELVGTSPGQPEKILKLHLAAQNLDAVRQALMRTVSAGEHADYAMAAENAVAEAGLTRR